MAVFVDPDSNFHQANANRLIYSMNYEARRLHWTHAGMACETYHVDAAADPHMPAHKVLMVTNAFCITDEQVEAMLALARRNAATVIWLMAPGIQTPGGFDLNRASRITGFRLRSADVEALPRISLVPGEHRWSQPALGEGRTLTNFGAGLHDFDDGGSHPIGPLFYVDVKRDPDVQVLGVLDPLGEPGLGVRRMDGYTSVYCAAPYVHNALLRAIGRDAGAHLYLATDDLVHAAAQLLLVHARQEGAKDLRLPRRAEKVVDLFSGRELGQRCRKLRVRMRKHETRLLFTGPARTLRRVRASMKGVGTSR